MNGSGSYSDRLFRIYVYRPEQTVAEIYPKDVTYNYVQMMDVLGLHAQRWRDGGSPPEREPFAETVPVSGRRTVRMTVTEFHVHKTAELLLETVRTCREAIRNKAA